jgi:hypothetical protein
LSNAHTGKGKIALAARDRAMLLLSTSTAMRGDNTRPILLSDLYSKDVPLVDVGLDLTQASGIGYRDWYKLRLFSSSKSLYKEIVFESPVRSGFLSSRGLDRDRDRSTPVYRPQKTAQNRHRPVYNGHVRFFAVIRPVRTSYSQDQSITGLDRSFGGMYVVLVYQVYIRRMNIFPLHTFMYLLNLVVRRGGRKGQRNEHERTTVRHAACVWFSRRAAGTGWGVVVVKRRWGMLG